MIKNITYFLFFSLIFAVTSVRNDLQYDFLNLGANAKVQALGNTGLINAIDAEAVLYNPANLFSYPHKNFVFSVNPLYFDSSHLYIFYSMDSFEDPYSKIGFGFIRFSIDGIEQRGLVRSDVPLGILSATDQAFIVASSRLISDSTSIGFSMGTILSNYTGSSDDFFMIFGVNHLARELKMKLNSTIQILNSSGYKISVGGLSYYNSQFIPTMMVDLYSNNRFSATYLSFGLEYRMTKDLKMLFGYNRDQISMGLGTTILENTDCYYAAVFTDLGVRHQYSFSMNL